MKGHWRRGLAIADVVGIPLFTQIYIWRLQFIAPRAWIVFPAWLVLSFLVQRDTPKTLGWRADNLWRALRLDALPFAAMAGALLAIGGFLGVARQWPKNFASLHGLWTYFAFCLLQQVALNSFLNNRLIFLLERRWVSSLAAGILFAMPHWPNPVLVPLTFVGGAVMAWLFSKERNILPLAVGQAILGSLVWWAFPAAWHHHLRVGPGFYRPL